MREIRKFGKHLKASKGTCENLEEYLRKLKQSTGI